jgi:hypothetical protein
VLREAGANHHFAPTENLAMLLGPSDNMVISRFTMCLVFLHYSLNNVADFHENWRNFSAMKCRNNKIPQRIPANMAALQNLKV